MSATTFGPLRCKLSRKPWIHEATLCLWHCALCGRVLLEHAAQPSTPCAPHIFPCHPQAPQCCHKPMRALVPAPAREAAAALQLSYDLVGGFNSNAVKVRWTHNAVLRPRWMALQTYTGVYCKQVPAPKLPPVVFPLADEDAYTYCDRDVCEKCLYCCKKGCAIYAVLEDGRALFLPLNEVSAYFQRAKARASVVAAPSGEEA